MVGKIIANYRITDTLGSGGMSVVYKAQDIRLGRFVALKFLLERFCSNRRCLEQFQQEARAASGLNHPGICTIHDIGQHEHRPFIVMEYLEGETLRDKLRKRGLTTAEALQYGIHIADALSQAHAAGIVHRDISPANLFITVDERVKLLDFGLATVLEADGKRATHTKEAKSACATLTGTIHYMSPEQANGALVDTRSDIFSVGVVLYEMLSGRRPFTGSSIRSIINQIMRATPEALANIDGDISPAVRIVVDRCLEKLPERRYQTAAELRGDLKSAAFIAALGSKSRVKTRSASTTYATECHDSSAETIPDTMPESSADDRP